MRLGFIYIILCVTLIAVPCTVHAQDTFYVKKKNKYTVVQQDVQPRFNPGDTTIRDSILTYTAEFKKPGSNVWVVIHCKGPFLMVPSEAYGQQNSRVLFSEIVCADKTGRRYRIPDRYYLSGIWAPVPPKESKK